METQLGLFKERLHTMPLEQTKAEAWHDMKATKAMASIAPGLGLNCPWSWPQLPLVLASIAPGLGFGAPSKVSHKLKRFSNGSALCKMKMALPFQR